MEKSSEFLKKIKKGKVYLVVSIIFIIIVLAFSALMYSVYQNDMKNPLPMTDVTEEGKYVTIEAQVMTDYFATNNYDDGLHKTYFVFDDKYTYIVDLDDKNRERLNEIYEYSYNGNEDSEPAKSVELKGMTKEIPSDLKRIAITSYNEIFGENIVNSANFDQYFGGVYLDTYEDPMTEFAFVLVICIPFAIIGISFLITYFIMKRNTKNSMIKFGDKWDQILNDIDANDSIYYKKAKLYLTRNYIISYQNGLEIFDYKDIIWVYPHEYRYNGVVTQKSIYVVTKNSKAHKLATISNSKKNRILFDELYNTLINKMPDILMGYTKENIKAAKELYEK